MFAVRSADRDSSLLKHQHNSVQSKQVFISPKKIFKGKWEESWTYGLLWQPKGVGVRGGCVPSHIICRELKRSFTLGFTECQLSQAKFLAVLYMQSK